MTIKHNTPFRLSVAATMGQTTRRDGLDHAAAIEALESKMGGSNGCSDEEISAFEAEYTEGTTTMTTTNPAKTRIDVTIHIITSRTDLETYIADARADVHMSGEPYVSAVLDDLQLGDHPAWGQDWSRWLETAVDESVAKLAAQLCDEADA